MDEVLIPIGNKKVARAQDATTEQLRHFVDWWDNQSQETAAKFAAHHNAAIMVLKQRREAEEADGATTTSLVQRAENVSTMASVTDPLIITRRLAELNELFHLISPAAQVDMMPVGFGVSVALVRVNPDERYGEVYPVGDGKVALSGFKIQEMAAASGVSWDPVRGGRMDDGSDPRYCHYQAVGTVKNFDGTERWITGQVEIDARDGSDLIRGDSAKKVLGIRRFILPMAESKARNRAVANSLGIRRSYFPQDLARPFAVARLIYTGHTDDPELTRRIAVMTAQAALGGARALFGEPPPPLVHSNPVDQDERESGKTNET